MHPRAAAPAQLLAGNTGIEGFRSEALWIHRDRPEVVMIQLHSLPTAAPPLTAPSDQPTVFGHICPVGVSLQQATLIVKGYDVDPGPFL